MFIPARIQVADFFFRARCKYTNSFKFFADWKEKDGPHFTTLAVFKN